MTDTGTRDELDDHRRRPMNTEDLEDIQTDIRAQLTSTGTPTHDIDRLTHTETIVPTYQTWSITEATELLDHIPIDELERMDPTQQQYALAHRVHEIVRSTLESTRRRAAITTSASGYTGATAVDPDKVPSAFD